MAMNLSVAGIWPNYDDFIAATPEERNAWLMQDPSKFGGDGAPGSPRGVAWILRNIVDAPGGEGWKPLTPEQLGKVFSSSNLDPALAQGVNTELGGIVTAQTQAAEAFDRRNRNSQMLAAAAFGGGALLGSGALGAAATEGAAGAGLSEGAAWGAGLEGTADLAAMQSAVGLGGAEGLGAGLSAAGAESFLGPATGTVEAAPVIGAAAAPEVTAMATGGGEFLPLLQGASTGSTLANLASNAAAMPSAMPPAVPPADPTFGGALTQTGPGQFENLAGIGAGGAAASLAGLSQGVTAPPPGADIANGTVDAAPPGAGAGTALSRILAGNGNADDYLSLLGQAAPGLIGAYASNQQADALQELANKYMAMGAPYRDRLAASYADPSAYLNSDEVKVPVQMGTDALARSLSVQGNPTGSGGALQEIQNYATNQFYNRLGSERDRLAGYGGLTAYNAAAPGAASAGVNADASTYAALGGAAADVFNPRPKQVTLSDIYKAMRGGTGSLA